MYKSHYDYIKNKDGNKLRLLFTGTDSLICGIKTEDFMKILAVIKKCLISLITQLSKNVMIIQTN